MGLVIRSVMNLGEPRNAAFFAGQFEHSGNPRVKILLHIDQPDMAEMFVRFQALVTDPDGRQYEARAYGNAIDDVLWEGWIEFVRIDGGAVLRTARETTQPNRIDTEYWATGLTPVYLEGALIRALEARMSARS